MTKPMPGESAGFTEPENLVISKLLRTTRFIFPMALVAGLLMNTGCDTIGGVGGLIAQAIPVRIDAAYKGLANQTVYVMVWMDRGMKNDYPDVQLDIAASLQGKLIKIAHDATPAELKGTEFPELASNIIRFQDDHPEIDIQPITKTAASFNATRLIYVEIKDFATHAGAPELFRGRLKGDIKVVEITPSADGGTAKAKIVFSENDIAVDYPKDSPTDGLPVGTETSITQGTIDAFTTSVAKRFYPHLEDRD